MAVTINTDYLIVSDSFNGEKIEISYEDADGTARYVADVSKYGTTVRLFQNDDQAALLALPAELIEAIGDEQREMRRQHRPLDAMSAVDLAAQLMRQWGSDVVRILGVYPAETAGRFVAERVADGTQHSVSTLAEYNALFTLITRDGITATNKPNRMTEPPRLSARRTRNI